MYESLFGFKEEPFNTTPDPRFLYLSKKHREALAHLIYGLKERRGFVVLSGEVGTGKTTLIRALLERLDKNFQIAYLFNPNLSVRDFLRAVFQDFNLQVNVDSRIEYLAKLQTFLLESHRHGKTSALIVDEAQDLETPLFKEIRMLTNLETSKQKLLQVVLVGQPELNHLLERPDLQPLKQRISIRYHLLPLDAKETREYIQTRLRIAGAKRQSCFTGGALQKIHEYSGGVPRVINNICDNSLLTAFAREKPIVDEQMVAECAADLGLRRGERKPKAERKSQQRISFWHSALFPALVVVLIALLAGGTVMFLSGRGNVPWRLPKRSETIQSFSQESQETEVKDGGPTEEGITESNEANHEVQLALEMPADSSITDQRETNSILRQEAKNEAKDTILEMKGKREERPTPPYGIEAPESSGEEIVQREISGPVTGADEFFQQGEGILISVEGTEGTQRKLKKAGLSKEVPVDGLRESEERATLAHIPAETSEGIFKDEVVDGEGVEERGGERKLAVTEARSLTRGPDVKPIEGRREELRERAAEGLTEKKMDEGQVLLHARKKEARQFFADYTERYNNRDIHGFLSLFSSKAMQNGTDGLDEIREIYSNFFSQSQEQRYHLEDMRIEIYQNVVVRARYKVVQLLKGTREEKVWTGDVRWVLTREKGELRVRYLDYKQDRLPHERKTRSPRRGTRTERNR